MKQLNRYYRRSKISECKTRQIIRYFALALTAAKAAEIVGLTRKSVNQTFAGVLLPIRYIHSDGWRGYDGLVDVGYSKHFRVNHSENQFADGTNHINGIESFWSSAKRRLQKFNGLPSHTFYLHLK